MMEFRDSPEFPLFSSTRAKPKINLFPRKQVKQFADRRYCIYLLNLVNNTDLPSYLNLPSIYSNTNSNKNLYNVLPCEHINKQSNINNSLFNSNNDYGLYSIIKQNTPKQGRYVMKSVEKSNLDSFAAVNPKHINFEGGYLKNVNEYCITENDQVNHERLIDLYRKPVKDFNVVNNEEKIIWPPSIKINKWGAFYDSYIGLAGTNEGFKKRNGTFSNYLDQNHNNNSLQKSFSKGMNNDKSTTRNSEVSSLHQYCTPTPSSKFEDKARVNVFNESSKYPIDSPKLKFYHKLENNTIDSAKRVLNSKDADLNINKLTLKSKDIVMKKNLIKLEKVINGNLFFNSNH
jgi:hypothetical protein